jgi:hypothetical protein
MKLIAEKLIEDLSIEFKTHIERVNEFSQLSLEQLNYKVTPDKWSILECIEHLNLYGDFYIPAIEKAINESDNEAQAVFKSGILGNYFVKSMKPKAKLNKMKTFSANNPNGSELDLDVISRFHNQQSQFLHALELAKKVNLTKTKTPISVSKIVKFRLGDTFRFIAAHNDRHILQAEKNVL